MILIFLIFNLWGQDVLIPSVEADSIQFEQYMLEHPDKKTFTQHYLAQTKTKEDHLLFLLKKAQYEFIDGSLDQAKHYFKQILELRHTIDWDKKHRKSIIYSAIRMAQMSSTDSDKEDYLMMAISFDDEIEPDEKLFPPPLLLKYYQLKKSLALKVWSFPEGVEHYKTVLINGKQIIASGNFFKSLPGEKRFTFISDIHSPITIVDSTNNIHSRKMNPIPLVQGHCQNPIFSSESQRKHIFGFFGKDCILPSHLSMDSPSQWPASVEVPSSTQELSSPKSYKWLWIGLGVVTTALAWQAVENQNRKSPSPSYQPTEKHFSNSQAARY